jgi:hypothetical protein
MEVFAVNAVVANDETSRRVTWEDFVGRKVAKLGFKVGELNLWTYRDAVGYTQPAGPGSGWGPQGTVHAKWCPGLVGEINRDPLTWVLRGNFPPPSALEDGQVAAVVKAIGAPFSHATEDPPTDDEIVEILSPARAETGSLTDDELDEILSPARAETGSLTDDELDEILSPARAETDSLTDDELDEILSPARAETGSLTDDELDEILSPVFAEMATTAPKN